MAIKVENLNVLFRLVMSSLRLVKRLYVFEEGRSVQVPLSCQGGFYMLLNYRRRHGKRVVDITYYHSDISKQIFVGTLKFSKYDTRSIFVNFLWRQWLSIAFNQFYLTNQLTHGDAFLKPLIEGAKTDADKKHYSAVLAGKRSRFIMGTEYSHDKAALYELPLYF